MHVFENAADLGILPPEESHEQQVEAGGERRRREREFAHVDGIDVRRGVANVGEPLLVRPVENHLRIETSNS